MIFTSRRPTALCRASVGSIRSLSIAPVSLWPTTIILPPTSARGQDFVLNIYHALVSNPVQWNQTLFVVVYDEHGGFYDHIVPPAAEDDRPSFRRYGVRVPAILVSPWVPQGEVVSKLFDHTSIIKTILLRFCRAADGSIPDMGKRVMAANHLGHALTEPAPRSSPAKENYQHVVAALAGWHAEQFRREISTRSCQNAPST